MNDGVVVEEENKVRVVPVIVSKDGCSKPAEIPSIY